MRNINNINVIAEVGLAHEGSMTLAMSYIDAISAAGADAVKFQTHIAESESTLFTNLGLNKNMLLTKIDLIIGKGLHLKKMNGKY